MRACCSVQSRHAFAPGVLWAAGLSSSNNPTVRPCCSMLKKSRSAQPDAAAAVATTACRCGATESLLPTTPQRNIHPDAVASAAVASTACPFRCCCCCSYCRLFLLLLLLQQQLLQALLAVQENLAPLHKALEAHHRGQQQQGQGAGPHQGVEVCGPAILLHDD